MLHEFTRVLRTDKCEYKEALVIRDSIAYSATKGNATRHIKEVAKMSNKSSDISVFVVKKKKKQVSETLLLNSFFIVRYYWFLAEKEIRKTSLTFHIP